MPAACRLRSRDLPADPRTRRSRFARSSVSSGPDRLRGQAWLARHGRRCTRWCRRTDRRYPSDLPARRWLGQGAGGQEDAGGCGWRLGAAVGAAGRRPSGHRRGHRDGVVSAGNLRSADLGRAVGRRAATVAMAGRSRAGDHLCRYGRCGTAGLGHAGRPAQHCEYRPSYRRAAAWRRLQRRPAPWRDGGRLSSRGGDGARRGATTGAGNGRRVRGCRARVGQPARCVGARYADRAAGHGQA